MSKFHRGVIFFAAVILGLAFLFPLWNIEIWAPQYPEGLFMHIWISDITGDIRNINILNHYIGMKAIEPTDFPELQYFPKAFIALITLGVLAAGIGKRWGLYLWTSVMFAFALWAFYDFWKWEHDFGNNLDPDAAIKMDGMTYSPPLLGKKELLNITAWSLPGVGGLAFALSVGLSILISILEFKGIELASKLKFKKMGMTALMGGLLILSACTSQKPTPILFSQDHCDHCKMTITDRRFGAEWVNQNGKPFKFDAIECLLAFQAEHPDNKSKIYVVDSTQNGELIAADQAFFVHQQGLRSPMGKGILVSKNRDQLSELSGGKSTIMNWSETIALLKKE